MTGSLDGVDRELLYPAIKSVLQNQDGRTRGELAPIYGKLTDRDIAMLLPDVIQAVQKMAPSGEMFADGIRLAGLDLLSRLGIREGMPLCVEVIDAGRWGLGTAHAEMPRIPRPLRHPCQGSPAAVEGDSANNSASPMITRPCSIKPSPIESSTKTPTLIGLEDFVKSHQ